MRIAIPVTEDQVANHLGACRQFLIADVEGTEVKESALVPNPGHGPGGPPPLFLAKMGVKQVVAWGMPEHARNMFEHMGVKVQLGATGEPKQVLSDYLNGTLRLTADKLDGGGKCSHE